MTMRIAIRIVLAMLTVGVLWVRVQEFRASAANAPLTRCTAQAQP
jgi:hypothetical protein